eukprot:scaffold154989_cov27-Tisochrysis_lutea.AAC.3
MPDHELSRGEGVALVLTRPAYVVRHFIQGLRVHTQKLVVECVRGLVVGCVRGRPPDKPDSTEFNRDSKATISSQVPCPASNSCHQTYSTTKPVSLHPPLH